MADLKISKIHHNSHGDRRYVEILAGSRCFYLKIIDLDYDIAIAGVLLGFRE
jgi:hypothetical protein